MVSHAIFVFVESNVPVQHTQTYTIPSNTNQKRYKQNLGSSCKDLFDQNFLKKNGALIPKNFTA